MKGRRSVHAAYNLLGASRAEQGPTVKTLISSGGVRGWKEHPGKAQHGTLEGKDDQLLAKSREGRRNVPGSEDGGWRRTEADSWGWRSGETGKRNRVVLVRWWDNKDDLPQ